MCKKERNKVYTGDYVEYPSPSGTTRYGQVISLDRTRLVAVIRPVGTSSNIKLDLRKVTAVDKDLIPKQETSL